MTIFCPLQLRGIPLKGESFCYINEFFFNTKNEPPFRGAEGQKQKKENTLVRQESAQILCESINYRF
jgi:hypothetical protein